MNTKFIFVTGGVVSSLGKGITAASLGRLLKCRGLRVSIQKFDPYINVDPGTMNPYQHGEVFVTDDGAETDLDLGHYERFIDESLTQAANVTSGRVYKTVIDRERRGEYLGATIQVIPHITNEIKRNILQVSRLPNPPDVVITEIGGTVGDIESLPFLEAIRQMRAEVGFENSLYIHVTLIPYIKAAGALSSMDPDAITNALASDPALAVQTSVAGIAAMLLVVLGIPLFVLFLVLFLRDTKRDADRLREEAYALCEHHSGRHRHWNHRCLQPIAPWHRCLAHLRQIRPAAVPDIHRRIHTSVERGCAAARELI